MFDIWIPVKDGNPGAFQLMQRHYSYREYADNRRHNLNNHSRRLFVGPGDKLVLVTPTYDALFVWRKFINKDRTQTGLNCAVFRNESPHLSSSLILAAEKETLLLWPEEHRLYTYVNPRKVRSTNAGFCFLKAGWRKCGISTHKLVILEKILWSE